MSWTQRLMAELHPPAPPPPPAPEPEPDSEVKRPGPRYNRLLPLPTELEMNERGIPLDW